MADVSAGKGLLACRVPASLPSPQQLAAVTLAMQSPLLDRWQSAAGRLPLLAAEHEGDLELATSAEFAQMRYERFAIPGASVDDYLNRWQPVTGDLTALLSIRFEGGDRDKPFVDLSGTSRPWVESDLPALARATLEVFHLFRPRYLRLMSGAAVDAVPGLGATGASWPRRWPNWPPPNGPCRRSCACIRPPTSAISPRQGPPTRRWAPSTRHTRGRRG